MTELKGKSAVITGGSRGLGKAIAVTLAKEGVNIGITGRNENTLKEVVAEIQALGVNAAYAKMDMQNEAQVNAGMQKLHDELGSINILINNAGIGIFGKINEMDSAEWKGMIETNLYGVYHAARAVYPFMKANGEGDIINIASTAGLKGGATMSAYAASKAAVISLSQSMMQEWRKDEIRVITLTPSTIATDMSIKGGLTDGNPECVLQPEDFAQWLTDILKMNRRALIANGSIFSTNPRS